MPADFDSGMFVREPAWHGFGVVVDDPPTTWEECRQLAGLTWDVIEEPVFAEQLSVHDDQPTSTYRQIPGWKRVVRSDTGATLYIGPDSYTLITHAEMGSVLDAIMGERRYTFETAGSLSRGKKVWALIKLGEPFQVPGDPSQTQPYVAILNSHNEQTSCQVIATATRIVCSNTFHLAEMDARARHAVYTFRHSRNWRDKLDEVAREARSAMRGASDQIAQYQTMMADLISRKVHHTHEKKWIEAFLPFPDEQLMTPTVQQNIIAAREQVKAILAGPTCDGIRRTAYGLAQAGAEYADHYRWKLNKETYFNRCVIRPEQLKRRAHTLALAAADGSL